MEEFQDTAKQCSVPDNNNSPSGPWPLAHPSWLFHQSVPLSLNILAHPFRFSVSPAQSRYPVTFSQSLLRRPRGQKVGLSPFGRPVSTMAGCHRIEYNWVKCVESLEEYQPGGYHPVMVADVLQDRYHILDKLGFGGYSTVWLARDTHLQRHVAVKINTANRSLRREAKLLKALSAPAPKPSPVHPERGLVSAFLDEFKVRGSNGEHTCYTMAPAQCNLREISFSRLFHLEVGRALSYGLCTRRCLYTFTRLCSWRYIITMTTVFNFVRVTDKKYFFFHLDIHLSNILIKLPSSFDDLSINI